MPIPFEVRDYCLHLENMWKWKGRYGQYLGSLRYQGTIGFLTYLFPSICDMQLYLHSRLPMMVDLKYTADDKSGVSFITDGKVILNISIEGEISFKDNEIAAGFLLFLNDAFGSGNIPSHEQFMNEDFSRFLN
ncbi:MAG: hypothetical protein NTY12_02410 [Candidatus Falkowbacteria bacterium]|nr:hypothetical protein [Candidatus Falkowbacteria bacterium]